jgi:RNA polymerase sigma factor (sigma-70 family)
MSTGKTEKEKRLVEGCLIGDAKIQRTFYEKYADTMYAICLRYSSNQDEAKDFLQAGFIKIFDNLDRFRFTGSLEGWMKRIMVNNALEQLRKKMRFSKMASIDDVVLQDERGVTHNMHGLEVNDLLEVISKLPTGYRTVFNLYVLEGYSHKDIGEELGINVGTSKSQLSKARNMLQERLKNYER